MKIKSKLRKIFFQLASILGSIVLFSLFSVFITYKNTNIAEENNRLVKQNIIEKDSINLKKNIENKTLKNKIKKLEQELKTQTEKFDSLNSETEKYIKKNKRKIREMSNYICRITQSEKENNDLKQYNKTKSDSIILYFPKNNKIFKQGRKINIKWKTKPVSDVKLIVYNNQKIYIDTVNNTGKYKIKNNYLPPGTYYWKIYESENLLHFGIFLIK